MGLEMDNNELLLREMQKKKTNHILHLLLTLLTAGLWVFVWIWAAHSNSKHNERLDEPQEKSRLIPLIILAVIVLPLAVLLI